MERDDSIHADVTITDRTKIPLKVLGWVIVGGMGCLTTIVTVVLWAAHIQDANANTARDVIGVTQQIVEMRQEIKDIREAQIRMESARGLEPSYGRKSR